MDITISIPVAAGVAIEFTLAQTLLFSVLTASVVTVVAGTLWAKFGKSIESRWWLAQTGKRIHRIVSAAYAVGAIVSVALSYFGVAAGLAFMVVAHLVCAKIAKEGNGSLYAKLRRKS
jgi:hypothetical protein